MDRRILWFNEVDLGSVAQVGGKTASLGELYQNLTSQGIRVPNGFGVTAAAYREFIAKAGLEGYIDDQLTMLQNGEASLQVVGQNIRNRILAADLPQELNLAIEKAYSELGEGEVAVRSSATAEDLPDASFAGQQESFLNVKGLSQLLLTCKKCFASLFTDRAISYREHKGFAHNQVALSICIQNMVRSDLASAGVMFTLDTESGFRDVVLINGAYGLGENVVQGAVNPDEFYVFKTTLTENQLPIIQKRLGSKEMRMIYETGGSKCVKNIPVTTLEQQRFCLTNEEIGQLARWGVTIENHYSKIHDRPTPMDVEWAKDGVSGELFIVQARPETVESQKSATQHEIYHLQTKGKIITQGRAVGHKVAFGPARIIHSAKDLALLNEGEVLVTDRTDPDWEPAMKKAAAIVTNRGGRTCHAAIVSRELGLVAVVGTQGGTEAIKDGQMVTVSCAKGDTGMVYDGQIDFQLETIDLSYLTSTRPKTQVMLNLANPEVALNMAKIPNDGVGLARMEFIVNHYIKIHPMALLKFDSLSQESEKLEIAQMTEGYPNKAEFFVEKLSQGIAMLAAAFYPKDVILRFSDFKTNEYANLLGGAAFEPKEDNPMIGFRGASRYYHPNYREGFALECQAVQRVRESMGLTNLKLMVPFCRTLDEGEKVLAEMAKHGLIRGKNGLEVYVMCEIPSNVLLADEFCKIFDGFSIGSNDLTQLTLGVDRDSEMLAELFDERNPAVKKMIATVIEAAKRNGKKIGICGQGPSDYPEFAQWLVENGIDSLSLSPDSVVSTTQALLEMERKK